MIRLLVKEDLMQIKRGTTRVTIIVFGLAFKFPSLKQRTVHGKVYSFFRGLIANTTEFASYVVCKRSSFLAPVFSLGFVNIMRFESGDKPTWDELDAYINQLSDVPRQRMKSSDHDFAPHNFRFHRSGLRMIDYGDRFSDPIPLSNFLRRHYEELDKILQKK
jgi:hypothetical protein